MHRVRHVLGLCRAEMTLEERDRALCAELSEHSRRVRESIRRCEPGRHERRDELGVLFEESAR